MSERTNREAESREATSRKRTWAPARDLETPPAPEGYKYRWIRRELVGNEDVKNVLGRMRQYYEPVMASELSGHGFEAVQTLEDGRHAGAVIVGDLMLMKVPEDIVDQRKEYYERKAHTLEHSVQQERERAGRMPGAEKTWIDDSNSTVKKGRFAS